MPPSQVRNSPRNDDIERDATDDPHAADEAKARHESAEETVSTPGGFKNDPDDPTNPNEAIERSRRKLRP